jgi:hypothetical protein
VSSLVATVLRNVGLDTQPKSASLSARRRSAAGLLESLTRPIGLGNIARSVRSLRFRMRRRRIFTTFGGTAALDFGRSTAHAAGADVAERIEWVEGDLGTWTPPPGRYDLVSCLYVHVAGSVVEMVRRLGTGVAPGGTLLLVGHRPIDPATVAPTPAAGQVQVSVDEAVEVLDPHEWDIAVAEKRPRTAVGTGVDAVVRAVRLG